MLISLAAATLFTVLQHADQYVESWRPVLGRSSPVTMRLLSKPVEVPHRSQQAGREMAGGHSATLHRWHVVVPGGAQLLPQRPDHVELQRRVAARMPPPLLSVLGSWFLFFTLAMALTSYLREFAQNRLRLLRAQIGVFLQLAGVLLTAKVLLLFTPLSALWIPTAVLPLWMAASFERRAAIVTTLVASFMCASLLGFDLVTLVVFIAHGISSVLLLFDRKQSRSLVWAGALAGLAAAAVLVGLVWALVGYYAFRADLVDLVASPILGCLGGGIVSGVLASLLRSPAERLLGHVPRERLHTLTDLEQPLLKRMAREAPGSWEHSRAMANLAEQAASAIGADALLVRVGAYYHDLGKSLQPKFFVENQAPGEPSPHDEIEPEVSAEVILAHVEEGTRILREGGIPEPVVEFSYTHHGTSVIEYFWNKCRQSGNPNALDREYFRYPGMKPQTKETAILMLVDSIEAASRTIDPPEREGFRTMVQRIIFTKLASGQLDDSGLRMRDLKIIVTRMVDTLVNMHHHRIKYPWQAKQAEQFGVPAGAVAQLPTSKPPPPNGRPQPVAVDSADVTPAPTSTTSATKGGHPSEGDAGPVRQVTTRH